MTGDALLLSLRHAWYWCRARWGVVLALLPVGTDWLDTGHWPNHPRELLTEVLVGALIFVGVLKLHARAGHYRELAHRDPLTGIGNRRALEADLAGAQLAANDAPALTLAYLDLNGFKALNDSKGHKAGDDLLRSVAKALEHGVRSGKDKCYRLGGDEFAVLFEGVPPEQCPAVLERALSKLKAEGISASIGMASLMSGESAASLVARADARMYQAKPKAQRGGQRLATLSVRTG